MIAPARNYADKTKEFVHSTYYDPKYAWAYPGAFSEFEIPDSDYWKQIFVSVHDDRVLACIQLDLTPDENAVNWLFIVSRAVTAEEKAIVGRDFMLVLKRAMKQYRRIQWNVAEKNVEVRHHYERIAVKIGAVKWGVSRESFRNFEGTYSDQHWFEWLRGDERKAKRSCPISDMLTAIEGTDLAADAIVSPILLPLPPIRGK